MRVVECAQGSEEWHAVRSGVITASMFKVARSRTGGLDTKQKAYVASIRAGMDEKQAREIAGYKAAPSSESVKRALQGEKVEEFSAAAEDYAFRLAVERISGKPLDEGFETWQMKRGHELEPAARFEHEVMAGVVVQPAGFVLTDDGVFGASADGLIGTEGGSEYKCLVSPEGLRNVLLRKDISEFIDQVQGCMWVTGRSWWHFCLYCPALEAIGKELTMIEVKRDDDYIEAMEPQLIEFSKLVQTNVELLTA